jgi:pimeloyl-ACP methyl ester carboxylesterase
VLTWHVHLPSQVKSWSQWEMSVGNVDSSTDTLVWDGASWSQQPRAAVAPAPAAAPALATVPGTHTAAVTTQALPQCRGSPQPGQEGCSSPLVDSSEQPSAVATATAGDGSYSHGPFTPALAWHSQWQPSAQEQLQQLLQAGLQHAGSRGMSQGSTQALLTCHYSMHGAFLLEEPLLAHMHCINGRRFPCIAVQGQQDLICPPGTAFDLHQAWPDMELRLVPGVGHSMYDPAITAELVCATDRMLQLV